MFLQQLITGLSVGSIYALMAVGYSLIYSLLNFTNFAHSASVLIGAYAGYYYITLVVDNPMAGSTHIRRRCHPCRYPSSARVLA